MKYSSQFLRQNGECDQGTGALFVFSLSDVINVRQGGILKFSSNVKLPDEGTITVFNIILFIYLTSSMRSTLNKISWSCEIEEREEKNSDKKFGLPEKLIHSLKCYSI